MTRKILILFAVLTVCSFALISSFFGERGLIVNNQLKRQLKENEYELDRTDMEIENLRLKDRELSTEDGSRSTAMSFGYQVEGDDVHVFDTEDNPVTIARVEPETEEDSGFVPWSTSFTLLISFCCSFIISLLVAIFSKDKGHADDSQQEESGDAGDNFGID